MIDLHFDLCFRTNQNGGGERHRYSVQGIKKEQPPLQTNAKAAAPVKLGSDKKEPP